MIVVGRKGDNISRFIWKLAAIMVTVLCNENVNGKKGDVNNKNGHPAMLISMGMSILL